MKCQAFVTPPRDIQNLRNRLQIEFENLRQNPGVIRNTVRSMEKRTRICIEKHGRHVDYKLAVAVPHGYSSKQLLRKYPENLHENNHAKL